ncbi:MAG: oxidoreductase [Gammaproteobacteria bacterium]|nr:oxidoreductase [Gammaproteobacteria bacterium]
MFKALLLTQDPDGKTQAAVRDIDEADLPAGEVLVKVRYSALNYKDALAITGRGKIVRHWPMVPGIDFAGTVLSSADSRFEEGDEVMLTGWGVGEDHWGGMAERARVKADWLCHLPDSLSDRHAMALGTAGLTAMLCVMALEEGRVMPGNPHPVVVTGASGGVGSVAVALLAQLGYQVVAVSGRPDNEDYLRGLGAKTVLARDSFNGKPRLLDKQIYSGVVDTVGGPILAALLSQLNYNGVAAACGLAGSVELSTSVMPFILRNVRLQGVDSVICPRPRRQLAWQRLGEILPEGIYEQLALEIPLDAVPALADALLDGKVTGRTLVRVSAED